MNAIILAAGEGKRLRPITNDKPKSLVKLFGKTLLEWQLSIFQKCGIDDICVVTGYNSQLINYPGLDYIKNNNFMNTNMMESLFCASEKFKESTIVSYADIIFEEKILRALIGSDEDFSIIIDKNWKEYWELRFENPIKDAESLKIDNDGFITNIGKKVNAVGEIEGQYIGLMKFQNNAIKKIKSFYNGCKLTYERNNTNPLNHNLPFKNSYMTDFLQGLIDNGSKLKAVTIAGGWLELDSMNDYNLYTKSNSEKLISKFFDKND